MSSRFRIRIAEPEGFSPVALARLRERAVVELGSVAPGELRTVLSDVDAFWFRLGHRFDASIWTGEQKCRVLATPVTGLDHIDLDACAANGVKVVSLRGEVEFLREVRATAELTIALLLAVCRRIVPAAEHVVSGGWDRDLFRGRELYQKRAGIVGLGRLGRIVASYLTALGMEVFGYDPFCGAFEGVQRVGSLGELFATCDVVSVHVSYDESTHHLVDGSAFDSAKDGLVLVNTSRGAVVDGAALVAALADGRVSAAALDVVEGEPDVAESPLVAYAKEHDNLVIVPHIGGNTFESFEKTELFLAERVLTALEDGAPAAGRTSGSRDEGQ